MPPLFHSDIASVEQLRKLLQELTASYEKLLVESKEGMKALQKETQNATKVTIDHVNAVKQEKDRYIELVNAGKKILKSRQDNEKAVVRDTAARQKNTTKLMEANTAAQKEVKTIEDMRKKVSALTLLWSKADMGSAKFKKLEADLNKTTAALKKQEVAVGKNQRNVGNYSSAWAGAGKQLLLSMGLMGGMTMIISKLSGLITGSIEKAGIQEKAERKLASALGYTSKSLLTQAAALQKQTTFGDEATIEAMSYLAMMGLEEKQVKKIIPLIQDMAAAKGMDLAQAADLVAKSLGSSTNAMSRYGIEITGAAGSSERLESAVTALTDKFGGQAAALADLPTGAIEQWSNAWGDLQEKLGNLLLPTLAAVATALTNILDKTSEGGMRAVSSFSDFVSNLYEGAKIAILGAAAYSEGLKEDIKRGAKKDEDDAAKKAAEIARDAELAAKRAAKIAEEKRIKDVEEAKKAHEEKEKIKQKEIDLANKRNDELWKLAQKQIEDELKLIDDAYKLKKELGITSYQEVYSYELEKITESAAYRKLIEGKTADEVIKIWKKAADKAKKAAQGFTVSGLPTPSDESDEQGDFMATMSAKMVIKPDDILKKDDWQETFGAIAEYAQIFGGIITDVLRMISDANQREFQQQMDEAEKRYTSETAYLDEQLRNKTISETQYNARKAAADQKKASEEAKLKKEYAKKAKDIAITQAIVNTALAVTSALTTQPFILGIILAVVAAALGAIEISTISSAQFAKGGHQKLGQAGSMLKGKRHSQGGVNLGEVGTAEAGEYMGIINRQATNKYESQLPLIFDSLNKQNFENVFAHPIINVNADSPYTKKMYKEMVKGKPAASETTIAGNMIITRTGNHTVRTYMG